MKKYFQYLKYVLRHKWFVALACFREGLYWQGLVHDLSKFLPSEFVSYAQYFYGKTDEEALDAIGEFGVAELAPFGFYTRDRFNVSWLKHQNRNPHHHQYWVLINDEDPSWALPMPDKYIHEMICDWQGAARAQGRKTGPKDWYLKNCEKMNLHPDTRVTVEKMLGVA